MDFVKGQLIDIIEWRDDTEDTMVYRFEHNNNEIKQGAKLTVRESQVAILVNEGTIADVYGPGLHELTTSNMPIVTTLKSWKYGFESPFKVDVYFVNTKQFTNQKWGTSSPVTMRDKEFGMVRLRGYGIYSFRVSEPSVFLKEVFGTCASYETEDITGHLKNAMVSQLSDTIAESGISLLDMATQYDELSNQGKTKFTPIFSDFGLELVSFFIQNISLPKEVEEMLDTKTKMGILGDMNQYAQFQTAQAIRDAAQNEGGGLAGAGAGIGAGAAIGQMMGGMMTGQSQQNTPQQSSAGTAAAAMMACPKCGAQIPQGSKFCPECGEKTTPPTVQCSKCHAEIPAGAKFCPECGQKQGPSTCPNCHKEVAPDAKFCPECGQSL